VHFFLNTWIMQSSVVKHHSNPTRPAATYGSTRRSASAHSRVWLMEAVNAGTTVVGVEKELS
jgi:hypothetical protein